MATQNAAPKIIFPCKAYPIKVIGDTCLDFTEQVIAVMRRHVSDFDASTVSERSSSKGNFCAIQVLITATGEEQLHAIHQDLRATGCVHMVL